MHFPKIRLLISVFLTIICLYGCKKETVVPNNPIPYYDKIPSVVIENYVNRTFIDLIGREPLDNEMVYFTNFLQQNNLSGASRDTLASTLQMNASPREGEISYTYAYHHWFYEKAKGRFFKEKAANEDFEKEIGLLNEDLFRDSLNGDTTNAPFLRNEIAKLQLVLNSEDLYRDGLIGFKEMMAAMINNSVYDFLNMNTFNFINASFDHLFYRYPSTQEFNTAFKIIEYNESGVFWGQNAETKDDYLRIISHSKEFYNGMITWTYKTLLVREPSSSEMAAAMQDLYFNNDLKKLERQIIISDEYAQFKY